ncbi:hypothetical protein CSOJ01_00795 [Colletotrichum sojae]|uniref:DUF6536 domain-containing protein n=1 Tax=Colletotrichum sojae TaxID=2175907 RepID=A0A8H6JW81_9PEZI|nr:hypothetical protein CSOJ01_00795 [Colletotrichum sojae]
MSVFTFLGRDRHIRASNKGHHDWLSTGWRKAAVVNIALMSVALLFLVIILVVAVSKTDGNFRQAWTFYTAVCGDSSTGQIDTVLHLLVNIVSTAALASSNFFMQVLNAPSRREVDAVHARGIWLDIGVPSWRGSPGRNWKRLDIDECRTIYGINCAGLREYRNVIVVTESPRWRRSDLWNLSAYADSLWEPIVPRNETNTLWYATQCKMGMEPNWGSVPKCDNNCDGILSEYPANLDSKPNGTWHVPLQRWYPDIPPTHINMVKEEDDANYRSYYPWSAPVSSLGFRSCFGRRFDLDALKISYCLAEPGDCKNSVALSKPLFLGVVLSVLSKLVICIVTVRVLGSEEALVTPGDAISSFISIQEGQTSVSGLLTQELVRMRVSARDGDAAYAPLGPQQWSKRVYRQERGRAVTPDVWRRTYFVLMWGVMAPIAVAAVQIALGIPLQWIKLNASEASELLRPIGYANNGCFIYSVLVANAPQLYLSFWYLHYNALITRLEMGREWALFPVRYCPLRVTRPKYSIVLFVMSAFTHWLISNAFFIIVFQGFGGDFIIGDDNYQADPVNLPEGSAVSIGTASLPTLILAILGPIMIIIPIVLSWKTNPGYMPAVGSNSLAISAARRVSPLAKARPSLDDPRLDQDTELEDLVPPSDDAAGAGENTEKACEKMVFCRLKWGEVEMPEGWCQQEGDDPSSEQVGHLSFGTVFDDPRPPTEGRWYR